jgi:hypothetical protein
VHAGDRRDAAHRRARGRARIYGEPTTVEFVAGMAIDADGALRAYHPTICPGLDRLTRRCAGTVVGHRHRGRNTER